MTQEKINDGYVQASTGGKYLLFLDKDHLSGKSFLEREAEIKRQVVKK